MRRTLAAILVIALAPPLLLAVEPKAVIEGPLTRKSGQSILLSGVRSVSDKPLKWSLIAPAGVSLLTFDQAPRKATHAFLPDPDDGSYTFALVAVGKVDDELEIDTAVIQVVVGRTPSPNPGPLPGPEIIPLRIGAESEIRSLRPDLGEAQFAFQVEAAGAYTAETTGEGAWRISLTGPDDPSAIVAVDDLHAGVGGNARIVATLAPGSYGLRVVPLTRAVATPFRVRVVAGLPDPDPIPPPPPSPDPTPIAGVAHVTLVYDDASPDAPRAAIRTSSAIRAEAARLGILWRSYDDDAATVKDRNLLPFVIKAGGPPALIVQAADGRVLATLPCPPTADGVVATLRQYRKAGGS